MNKPHPNLPRKRGGLKRLSHLQTSHERDGFLKSPPRGRFRGGFVFLVLVLCIPSIGFSQTNKPGNETYSGNEYPQLQKNLAKGWNTWNTKSVLSHVLLPECFSLNLQLHNSETGKTLENALIGRQGNDKDLIEKIDQGSRTYNGEYTDLIIEWQGIKLRIQSTASENNLNLLLTPVKTDKHSILKVKPEFLWKRDGSVQISNKEITARSVDFKINIYAIFQEQSAISTISDSCLNLSLSGKIGFSTDKRATIETIERAINEAHKKLQTENQKHRSYADLYEPMQNVLAWNTIYEPSGNRVISLVSQAWSEIWGGFMLPVWDTYFAAYMLSFDNKDLAYSNALAITKSITAGGFVPNVSTGFGKTEDRSQPPVGSFVMKELYRKYREKWMLHETFNELLAWNRWWDKNRNLDGFLCWGSTPYDTSKGNQQLAYGVNELQGALYESGLDNSSMYDGVQFDKEKHVMLLADVGLMSFYVLDCKSLAEIAMEIGKPEIASELNERAAKYAASLQKLWNEKTGIFQNKHLDTGIFSEYLSPTLFYPLLAGVATQKQAERMIQEHFYNPDEFWGEYIMPCTARNETAFKDNHYFRGRIWGPMNFLVYLGLRKYNIGNSTSDMAEKSKQILLKTWNLKHDVYENYSATTGEGFDVGSSQKSYYWGALLGFISLMENGFVEAPEKPISTKK